MTSLVDKHDGASGIAHAEWCIAAAFFLIPVLLKHGGIYDADYPRIGMNLFVWWLVYSLVYFSFLLTVLGVPLAFVHRSPGLQTCGIAAILYCFTFIAFMWGGKAVPRWLVERLRAHLFPRSVC
jgi:hypothetical protein